MSPAIGAVARTWLPCARRWRWSALSPRGSWTTSLTLRTPGVRPQSATGRRQTVATRADLHQTFGSRLAGLESLIAARDSRFVDAERLRREAEDVDRLAPFYDRTATGAAYGAFAELLRIAALLVQWRAAVLTGEADSGRFLGAAKERHRIWKEEAAPTEEIGRAH